MVVIMEYIHSRDYFKSGDVIKVNCSHECKVMLLDNKNYDKFRSNQKFEHYGGFYKQFPVKIKVPSDDTWNIILDFGDKQITVKYSIDLIDKS